MKKSFKMILTPDRVTTLTQFLYYFGRNRSGVRYGTNDGEYIWNSNGRIVDPKKIQKELNELTVNYYKNIDRLSDQLENGRITIAQWQARMRTEILDLHRTQYIIGRGGRAQMTFRDWGRLGADLRHMHYPALDQFALDIANGNRSAAQIHSQARLYANSSNKQFWRGRTEAKLAAGFTAERRLLQPGESCDDCKMYDAMGWVAIGSTPDPGEETQCQSNCNCIKIYERV